MDTRFVHSELTRMYIDIEGISQFIQIDSNDPEKPVLLMIHGGPGAAATRLASLAWQQWLDHFTIVHWDQRGAGLTLARNGPEKSEPMTFNQIVLDGLGVATFLQNHLGCQRIFLLGHSWGSAVAVHMIKRRPELFTALVVTGFLINFEQNEHANYQREIAQARNSQNQAAMDALAEIGPPPYDSPNSLKILREWADKLTTGTGDSPCPRVKPPADFSSEDREALMQGFAFSIAKLFHELCSVDLLSLGRDFEIPIFCFMGTHDQQTPIELAERYFETINAPRKAIVRFEGCHHFVHMNRPHEFLEALVKHLL